MSTELPITESHAKPSGFPVVGIGASAGGLEAFLDLFSALPPDTGMAFILVQHLEPHHASQMSAILSRSTKMPVVEASDGLRIQPNRVYVIPPNAAMTIKDRTLRLSPRTESNHPHHPIDIFFRSLAEDQGGGAIGIVLSGTGSDGAHGLQMIKCAAGTTIAQDESAKFEGMPQSAAATSTLDFVLPPKEIAAELVRISAHPFAAGGVEPPERAPTFEHGERNMQVILDRLRRATKVDFSEYKQNTVRRRIARRMLVHNVTTLEDYVSVLENKPSEIDDLYRDLLISVTSFFREPGTFQALPALISNLLKIRKRESPYRVWVAGCATGEEAYSLAIVIAETIEAAGLTTPIQLFGTDISEASIDHARKAVYPDLIEREISPLRLRKFFTRVDSGYRVVKSIRDRCIFARHDLVRDPPFSQLDLASCRNVLIYLGPAAQQRALPALHYSLKPDGLLILGGAETIGTRSDLFDVVDSENKIFSKKLNPRRFAMTMPDPVGLEPLAVDQKAKDLAAAPTIIEIEICATKILRDLFAPPGVIVDDSMQILHFHGHTSAYLQPPAGEASLNLLRVANPSLVMSIRKAFDIASRTNEPAFETNVPLQGGEDSRDIGLRVIPFTESNLRSYMVLFEDNASAPIPPMPPIGNGAERDPASLEFQLAQTRRELAATRDYLRTVIEQHEVVTEELRAANEEVQSSNEELQSTNEEIRTAKEELQSSNEELRAVNDELQDRNQELRDFNDDLNNVLNAVNIPIVILGMDLRIRRCTPAAEKLLNTLPTDVGRPIAEVHYALLVPNLNAMIRETLETLTVQQSRIQNREGRWYSVFVRPYRTEDNRIDGVVIAFFDIDELTRALAFAVESRDFAEGIVETVQHPMLVLDSELKVQRATAAFYKTFALSPKETVGISIYQVGTGQWSNSPLRASLDHALTRDVPFRDIDVEWDLPDAGKRIMRLNGRRIVGSGRSAQKLLLAIEDVTDRKEAAEIQYRRLFESAKVAIIIVDGETGRILDVNPFFLELARYGRADIAGKLFSEIAPFRKAEAGRTLVQLSMEKEVTRFDSVPLLAQDGRQLVVEMVANRYRAKEQILVQVNIRDVTERRQAEEDLRRSNLDLQQFAFAASHDLQEPLRTVINHIQLLQEQYRGKLDDDADESIGFITSAADRMRHMILDLLSYSQMSRAAMKIEPIQVESVLANALANLQLAISDTRARITFDTLPSVEMDQTQLLQLLQNLIGNALKYRSTDPPHVHISARQTGTEWAFAVKDNGLGIESRHRDQIFTVFKRLHGKEYPGTGIGLATCKRIVERHGGRIWVESEVGKGSTFYFTVQIAHGAQL